MFGIKIYRMVDFRYVVWSTSSLFGPGGAGVYISHAPSATHPIPCPFPLVQLPPASQLKPLLSSKVSFGVLAI